MEINTPIAEDIHITDDNAKLDASCKRLLSEKSILAWIMKSCLEEYRDCDVKDIAEKYIEGQPEVGVTPVAPDETNTARIRGIHNEDSSLTEGTVTYDIRFLAMAPVSGELIQIIVDVEAQHRFDPGYPLIKRAIYYCSRMISAQYGTEFTHSQYQKICKVYSIWICLTPPKERRNSVTRYRLAEENLIGAVKEQVRDYDLLSVVMLCLGGSGEENYDGVLKLLDVLLSSEAGEAEKKQILQNDFDIPMTQTLESEVRVMCNLSQGVMEKGIEQGMKQGMEQGMKQGMENGKVEGLLTAIRNLMTSMGWSAEQAMEALRVSETERQKYAAMLQRQ